MRDRVLAVDCGTQSLRVIIFNKSGEITAKAKIEYEPYTSPHPGWAEQDPEVFWQALLDGCAELREKNPGEFSSVAGIGVTSQRDTMINIEENGLALRPAITWLDTRKAEGGYKPNAVMKAAYRLCGMERTLTKTMRDAKCNWIRENQPGIWEKTWKYVEVSGFLNHRLCGEPVDSVASMVGHIPFDNKRRDWAGPSGITSKLCPVENSLRYRLVEPGEQAGRLTAAAAAQTGLPEGLPVIACGSDKACETLGAGCLDTSIASLSFGTTATVEVLSDRYFEPLPFLPAYCAAYPGAWVPEIEIYRGYWMISWFRDELGHEECEKARRQGVLPEELFNKLLESEPPGCMGLMMQPYWGPGLKDPMAKGAIIGFGDTHTRSSIYRATIEGLGYALRDGLETLEKRGGFNSERVAVSGGASQSDIICQISADIFGKPHFRGETYEASSLGAAVLISSGLGLHPSVDDAVKQMVRYEREFTPDKARHELYSRLFSVYKRIYPKLNGLYEDIQRITGYPEL
ncbi:MAG: FGGY-family carbohydrate kinase [Spirochaetales bacterium]|uniref:FGGY-family carbohydrate kinase n=1 Tax=Candidatus Thalassospirochaeta sargassi TaxID=3119039 RepID=A0AAJ1IH53_9SPIO|nr:FGGY-family carbohydrate kinase [Spirochaetales bacterium]